MKYSSVCLPGSVARASPPFIFRNYPPSPVLPPRASLPCRIHRVLHLFQLPPPSTLFVVVVVVVVVVIVIVVELLVSGPLPSLSFSSPLHVLLLNSPSNLHVRSFVRSMPAWWWNRHFQSSLLFSHLPLPDERREKVERRAPKLISRTSRIFRTCLFPFYLGCIQ